MGAQETRPSPAQVSFDTAQRTQCVAESRGARLERQREAGLQHHARGAPIAGVALVAQLRDHGCGRCLARARLGHAQHARPPKACQLRHPPHRLQYLHYAFAARNRDLQLRFVRLTLTTLAMHTCISFEGPSPGLGSRRRTSERMKRSAAKPMANARVPSAAITGPLASCTSL